MKRQILISLFSLFIVISVSAQKHSFKLGVGDAVYKKTTESLLSEFLFPRDVEFQLVEMSLAYYLGYRYHLSNDRWRVGLDCLYHKFIYHKGAEEINPDLRYKLRNLHILPTVEFYYLNKGLFRLYGSASIGVNLYMPTSDSKLDLAPSFHISPLSFRIGNEKIGAFFETGFGFKGALNAGIEVAF